MTQGLQDSVRVSFISHHLLWHLLTGVPVWHWKHLTLQVLSCQTTLWQNEPAKPISHSKGGMNGGESHIKNGLMVCWLTVVPWDVLAKGMGTLDECDHSVSITYRQRGELRWVLAQKWSCDRISGWCCVTGSFMSLGVDTYQDRELEVQMMTTVSNFIWDKLSA